MSTAERLCFCPDDCACHYPHRLTVCGCQGHATPPPARKNRANKEPHTNMHLNLSAKPDSMTHTAPGRDKDLRNEY